MQVPNSGNKWYMHTLPHTLFSSVLYHKSKSLVPIRAFRFFSYLVHSLTVFLLCISEAVEVSYKLQALKSC